MDYKKLFKVTPKHTIKPIINLLYVKNGFVYATDLFKSLKLKTNFSESETGFITDLSAGIAYEKSKVLKMEILPELSESEDHYPDIDSIIPKETIITLSVNRQYLIDLLTAMQKPLDEEKKGNADEIVISITNENKAIMFENRNGTGLLMPLNK